MGVRATMWRVQRLRLLALTRIGAAIFLLLLGAQVYAAAAGATNLSNTAVQSNLQDLLANNPALAAQVQQTLAGTNAGASPTNADNSNTNASAGDQTQANASAPNNATNPTSNSTTPPSAGANGNANQPTTNQTDNNQATTTSDDNQTQDPWQSQDPNLKQMREQSFQNVTNQAFPLTPTQIQTLNNMLDDTQRAQAAAPYEAPPMPTSTSLLVNLDPGATPPVIRLSKGFVSSMVFVDSTGAPWPIEAYDLGNPAAFNIKWDNKSNTLMIQAMASYTYGNLAVRLQNLNTPVMLTLVPGQKQIDYRVDLRIQGLGPNAKPIIGGASNLPGQADQRLLDILDGIAPTGAKQLHVSGDIAEVWIKDNDLFVRTRFDLISPAWLSKMSSADGTNAYKLQPTPLLLVSRYGKVMQLKVEGL